MISDGRVTTQQCKRAEGSSRAGGEIPADLLDGVSTVRVCEGAD
jgi:hypothetical protein